MNSPTTSPISFTGTFSYYSDISYDKYNRTKIDMFVPESTTPVAAVVHYHGGGFVVGSKDPSQYNQTFKDDIQILLDNNIAFIYVNYRLLSYNGERNTLLKCLDCGVKSVNYIFNNFSSYNIDLSRICMRGSSAGNGLIMHNLHYGIYAPKAVLLLSPQVTYDPFEPVLVNEGFDIILDMETYPNSKKTYLRGAGVKNIDDLNRPEVTTYRNSVNYVGLSFSVTINEAYVETLNNPTPIENNPTLVTHHFRQCISIHNKFLSQGMTSSLNIPTAPSPHTVVNTEDKMDFMLRILS